MDGETVVVQYVGGHQDGRRETVRRVKCGDPNCSEMVAPGFIAITPADGSRGARPWDDRSDVDVAGVYRLVSADSVDGAVRYRWHPGGNAPRRPVDSA